MDKEKSKLIRELIPHTKRISGIYKIENKINGKIYIGQSVDVFRRLKKHLWDINKDNNTYLARALNRYGIENFTYEIIEICSPEELDEKEINYIKQYHSYVNDPDGGGYNLNTGGGSNRGWSPTKETREKFAEMNKGGKSHFAKRTWCDDILFTNAKSVAQYMRIPYATVKDWLSGKAKMPPDIYERELHYDGEDMSRYDIALPKKVKIKYDGNVYLSMRQFCRETGIDRNLIRQIRSGEKAIPDFLKEKGFEFVELIRYPKHIERKMYK